MSSNTPSHSEILEEALKNHPFNPGPLGLRPPNMFSRTPQMSTRGSIIVPEHIRVYNENVNNRQSRRSGK